MTTLALDTLKVSKRLREAGFSEAQAESVTDAIRESVTGGDLATRSDITLLRSDLSAAVSTLEAKIADSKAEMIKWVFGAMLAQGALVVTLIKLLPGKF
jgi:hypothetical protein